MDGDERWYERLDRLRRERGVKSAEVAAAVGKSEGWASRMLRGDYAMPSWPDMERIAALVGATAAQIAGPEAPIGNVMRAADARPGPGMRLPIVNTVDAGPGPGHDRQVEEYLTISPSLLGGIAQGQVYIVSGECLRDALIAPGDHLIIDPDDKEPEDGEIVVARVNGVAVAKRFYRFGDTVELRPASLGFETVIVRPHDDFEIVGTYVAVMRPARARK